MVLSIVSKLPMPPLVHPFMNRRNAVIPRKMMKSKMLSLKLMQKTRSSLPMKFYTFSFKVCKDSSLMLLISFLSGVTWEFKFESINLRIGTDFGNRTKKINFMAIGCLKQIVPRLCCYCGGAVDSLSRILHSCISQASTLSLIPCMSQSDMWLLIYGGKNAK